MSRVYPIQLPGPLVREREIDLANKFEWMHRSVCTGPGGDRYVLSDLAYNYYRYNDADRDREMLAGHVLTRYAPDGAPAAQAFLGWGRANAGALYPPVSLSILPDGRALFATKGNRAFVLDAGLGSAEEATAPGGASQWAFRTRLTPSGRALCLLGENVVALSPEPVGATLPALTAVTALSRGSRRFLYPLAYGRPTGASGEGEPRTELIEQLRAERPGPGGPRPEWLYDAVPVDDTTFVVLAVGWKKWAYKRGGDFVFLLVDAEGRLLGRLDLDRHRDAAARGVRYDVVVDQARRRIFHLSTFGLYVFDDQGTRTARLATDDPAFKPLARFQLREFDPAGHLVLVHEKQNVMLTVPVPEDLADLPGTVTDALALFRRERSRLKKEQRPENWYWTTDDAPLAFF
ncbi:hypothetical protein [Actinomadura sp. DC4]|uniref:hypothetical protein n=1 Tax=Actinomadura sp. DC4 TaxID=3055069 RepID=UPI0025B25887|nr:hypothetical protein [Actinomadura sp. DC4]MDN3357719.1 hypothetical protein [Actinomadura sp. DC4]